MERRGVDRRNAAAILGVVHRSSRAAAAQPLRVPEVRAGTELSTESVNKWPEVWTTALGRGHSTARLATTSVPIVIRS